MPEPTPRRSRRQIPGRALALLASLCAGCGMSHGDGAAAFDGPVREMAVAIDNGDTARLRALAQQGIPVDEPGRERMTLLWHAVRGRHYDAVRELVALGADPDANGVPPLGTPLQHALTHDRRLLQAMLDGGMSPNRQTAEGITLLQRAMIGDGAEERVRLLVERGADVNLRDRIGGSALSEAIDARKPELALYLLEQGAAWDAAKTNGDTPAWGVQWSLQRLRADAPQGQLTDVVQAAGGEPVARDATPPAAGPGDAGTVALRQGFERVRAAMIARGATFPAQPPAQVRERMKAEGRPVAE